MPPANATADARPGPAIGRPNRSENRRSGR